VPDVPDRPRPDQPEDYCSEEVTYTAECPEGYIGEPVTVTIPAGEYCSPIPGRATAIALQRAAFLARQQLSCQLVVNPNLRFCCSTNGNYVETVMLLEDFGTEDLLELDAFTNQLDCSVEACEAITGTPVEASKEFVEVCIGGSWYSDPLPDLEDRWTVGGHFFAEPNCIPGENVGV
jgi:hypothetical protein